VQDKYVGDIGDYGKFGLLRFLSKACPEISIGINWYYVGSETDKGENSDGRFIEYLDEKPEESDLQKCDPGLIEILREIVLKNRRKVSELMKENIVPGATYYAEPLEYSSPSDSGKNKSIREEWFDKSAKTLEKSDIIFTDEDNGVQVSSVSPYSRKGKKYISYDEIEQYYKIGKSIIIYNHHSMEKSEKYLGRFVQIKNRLKIDIDCMDILTFSKYSGRDYVFIIQSEHRKNIKKALDEFKKSRWFATMAFNQRNWESFQQIIGNGCLIPKDTQGKTI
jgi:hypothetical protein